MSWIVFDYGEVVSRRTRALPALAAGLGADEIAFENAYWAYRHDYDGGMTDLAYWRAVGALVGADVEVPTAAPLTKIDTTGLLPADRSTVELLEELRAAGARLALLSNAPASFARAAEG